MACPNLKGIEKQLKTGVDFSLTDNQYLKSTGLNIPKSEFYLKSKSAINKKAEQYGYKMQLVEKTLIFKKERKDV